jgi:hypothetical protein
MAFFRDFRCCTAVCCTVRYSIQFSTDEEHCMEASASLLNCILTSFLGITVPHPSELLYRRSDFPKQCGKRTS